MKFQYFANNVVLVLNPKGEIKKLFTPFKVQNRQTNVWVYVDEVLSNEKDELFFMINSQPVQHHHFNIIIHF